MYASQDAQPFCKRLASCAWFQGSNIAFCYDFIFYLKKPLVHFVETSFENMRYAALAPSEHGQEGTSGSLVCCRSVKV